MAITKMTTTDLVNKAATAAPAAAKPATAPAAAVTKPATAPAAAAKPATAPAGGKGIAAAAAAAAVKAANAATAAAKAATAKTASQVSKPTNSVRGNALAGIAAAAATANAAATAVIQTTKVDSKDLNTSVNSAMKANAALTVAKEQVKNAVAQNNKAIAGANLIVGAKPSVWLKAVKAITAAFVSSFAAKAKNDAKLMDTLGFIKDSKTGKYILKAPKQAVSQWILDILPSPLALQKPATAPATAKKVGFDAEFADFNAEFADFNAEFADFTGSQRAATIAGIVTAMEEEDLNFLGAERASTIGGILTAMQPVETNKISTSPQRSFKVIVPLVGGAGCLYNPKTRGYVAKQSLLPKVGDVINGRIVEIDRLVPSGKGKVKVKQQGIYYTINPFGKSAVSYMVWIPLNKLQEVVPSSLKQMIGFDAEFADADGEDFGYEPDFVTRDLSFTGYVNAEGEAGEIDMFDEEMENASGEDLFDSVEISEIDESVGFDGEEEEDVIIQKIIQ